MTELTPIYMPYVWRSNVWNRSICYSLAGQAALNSMAMIQQALVKMEQSMAARFDQANTQANARFDQINVRLDEIGAGLRRRYEQR